MATAGRGPRAPNLVVLKDGSDNLKEQSVLDASGHGGDRDRPADRGPRPFNSRLRWRVRRPSSTSTRVATWARSTPTGPRPVAGLWRNWLCGALRKGRRQADLVLSRALPLSFAIRRGADRGADSVARTASSARGGREGAPGGDSPLPPADPGSGTGARSKNRALRPASLCSRTNTRWPLKEGYSREFGLRCCAFRATGRTRGPGTSNLDAQQTVQVCRRCSP